jgi:hypothetical protein
VAEPSATPALPNPSEGDKVILQAHWWFFCGIDKVRSLLLSLAEKAGFPEYVRNTGLREAGGDLDDITVAVPHEELAVEFYLSAPVPTWNDPTREIKGSNELLTPSRVYRQFRIYDGAHLTRLKQQHPKLCAPILKHFGLLP